MCSSQETSSAGGRHGRPPRFLEKLEALYGDRNRHTGCFMSAGGLRASMPPPVVEPQHFYGTYSDNSSSKRGTRDHVVNSLEKKKSCNVGEYMARLSESNAARSTSRDQERTHE